MGLWVIVTIATFNLHASARSSLRGRHVRLRLHLRHLHGNLLRNHLPHLLCLHHHLWLRLVLGHHHWLRAAVHTGYLERVLSSFHVISHDAQVFLPEALLNDVLRNEWVEAVLLTSLDEVLLTAFKIHINLLAHRHVILHGELRLERFPLSMLLGIRHDAFRDKVVDELIRQLCENLLGQLHWIILA